MKRPRILSAAFVRTVTQPGRYGDGRGGYGLGLLVKPTANGRLSKTWSQRVRFHGRVTNIGLGAYPIVTLAEARKKSRREPADDRSGTRPPRQPRTHLLPSHRKGHSHTRRRVETRRQIREAVAVVA